MKKIEGEQKRICVGMSAERERSAEVEDELEGEAIGPGADEAERCEGLGRVGEEAPLFFLVVGASALAGYSQQRISHVARLERQRDTVESQDVSQCTGGTIDPTVSVEGKLGSLVHVRASLKRCLMIH